MSANSYQLSEVIRSPIISEKGTNLTDDTKSFIFKVQNKATKQQVKQAVELMFDVKVESVNVLNVKGKQKRSGRTLYTRSDWKKAYVKLKQGYDIEFAN